MASTKARLLKHDFPVHGSHPNFPHIQSIEYAEHADQPRACCKTQEEQPKRSRKKEIRGKGGFVKGGFG